MCNDLKRLSRSASCETLLFMYGFKPESVLARKNLENYPINVIYRFRLYEFNTYY